MPKIKVKDGMVFERHEKKYRLTTEQYLLLLEKLSEYTKGDRYGRHTICSLYFDTDDYLLIRRSIEKPKYKEKFRLRSYGMPTPNSTVFLELKKKLDGVTYKRRIPLTLAEAERYLKDGQAPEKTGQILEEIDWFIKRYKTSPKVLLFYERIALYGIEDESLRITFDSDIRFRTKDLDFIHDDSGIPLLNDGERIMEIKIAGAFPIWLSRLLAELNIYPTSFSKYGIAYRMLNGGRISVR